MRHKLLRLYYNEAGDPATVWSYDDGPGTEEHYCGRVNWLGLEAMVTRYDIEAMPSAWVEMRDVFTQLKDDLLVISSL